MRASLCKSVIAGFCLAAAMGVSSNVFWAAAQDGPLSQPDQQRLFEMFDMDSDGAITATELAAVVGSFQVDLSAAEQSAMVATFDGDSDGQLQSDEFAAFLQGFNGSSGQSKAPSLAAQMERSFLRFDTNRDGGLDAREIQALMADSGKTISLRQAKTIVLEADDDGNGRIDAREFNAS